MSLIKINNDMFNIVQRIRDIDKNYYVLFNTKSRNYELHHKAQKYSSFCLNLGKTLDAKCVNKTLKTKSSNFVKIFNDLDFNNRLVKSNATQIIMDKATCKLKTYISYLDHSTKSIDFSKVD